MAQEERKKVELWAEATKRLSNIEIESSSPEMESLNSNYLSFLSLVATQNTTIPIIIVEQDGSFNADKNVSYNEGRREEVLTKELKKMKDRIEPIRIDLSESEYHLLYYRESSILRNLRFYPFVQLFVIIIFILVAYFAFSATQRAEQNQVWVGMSKETAHQLGTPISSLMAWIELLKLQDVDQKLINEFEKDTQRLEKITERFSKIGSKPELLPLNVVEVLNSTINYLKTRSSQKVNFETSFNENDFVETPLNAALFSWVIENICKNSLDAMNNDGIIAIALKEKNESIFIDITDNGKGVIKSHFKTIFQPGYSTKKRGWGLGLSLAKRIIENYHNGKIFIKWSEIGKGTTFRIVLNK
ncbi:MAG: HAMP domain-containing histidine kinase [Prolixibacteraceae bacterium]|nr:HAMP domain-containing histidine kinase [Prolixibacteraceae bacterium]MBT6006112.1 HAMP domain-containing histidine kinase [Prolixibacteraceae bacterium]MBT6763163.1 HAMP domain-containing histidine kinase [Prolixibacteraceae bacterium]MBT6998963.1 HAMP domain-containing histidine kinase [Prolixibacteraceae bacterium]MBT7393912.1 HAMP domain-containing histidine kinase [Prolixibacteraceae bacterium]